MTEGAAPPALAFEEALARLEQIVREMEDGTLPLQRMLVLFEEGTLLGRRCQGLLDVAELRIKQVTQDTDGALRIQGYDARSALDGVDPAF